jgi:hypothetical protein
MSEDQIKEMQQENEDWLKGYGLLFKENYELRSALKDMLDAWGLHTGNCSKNEAVGKALMALTRSKEQE